MTADIPQYSNPLIFGSVICDVTHGNFKLQYLEFGKWYRDGWPLEFSGASY